MENLEKRIKKSLQAGQGGFKKSVSCPSEVILGKYLEGVLPMPDKDAIEKHLAECGYCLDIMVLAKGMLNDTNKKTSLLQGFAKQKWFILSMASFLFSFFVRRYFLQFLTLSLILGIKWALSAEGSRNLVMIFRTLSHSPEIQDTEESEKVFGRK